METPTTLAAVVALGLQSTREFNAMATSEGNATPIKAALSEKGRDIVDLLMTTKGSCGSRQVTTLQMFGVILDEDLVPALREAEANEARVEEGAQSSSYPLAVVRSLYGLFVAHDGDHDGTFDCRWAPNRDMRLGQSQVLYFSTGYVPVSDEEATEFLTTYARQALGLREEDTVHA